MNRIAEKQNQDKFLQYLAAQRQLYSEGKRWSGVLIALPVIFAVLGNITFLAINWTFVPPLITWFAWLYAIGELFFFSYLTSSKRAEAAKIQELFDCEILELPWNDALGNKPKPENIFKAFQRFRNHQTSADLEKLKDWYTTPPLDANMSIPQARVVCQKQNIWWDSEQRRVYARGVVTFAVAFFLALITVGIIANWSFRQFLQGPLALSLTVLIIGLKHGLDHHKAAKHLDDLYNSVNDLWKMASAGTDEITLTQKSRNLQTEIFHHRNESPSVFTWYYNRIRDRFEDIAQKAQKLD